MSHPLWLDCDTGHDDAFAILLAACHPAVHLLGVSTVYGNAPLVKTTYNTRAILKAVGRDDVPVYAGVAKPFCREVVHAPDIHGESGLDGTSILPVPEVDVRNDKDAVSAMYAALMSTPKGTAWLVPTGAMTNAALLFALHPDVIDHIAGVSIMGGAIGGGFTDAPSDTATGQQRRIGNTTPWAEFNVYIDPESAKSILSNPSLAAKTTLVTLDLTHQFLATSEVQQSLLAGGFGTAPNERRPRPSSVRQLFVEILAFFARTYANVFGITAGPPVHDPLAVVAAFQPELFVDSLNSNENIRYTVDVVTEGAHATASTAAREQSQCGRTVATPLPRGDASGGVRIPKAVDAEKVWQLIDHCLSIAEKATG